MQIATMPAGCFNRLQVADCFDGIVDILDVSPYCKPMPEAFATACAKPASATRANACSWMTA
jgi:FMN phosphatase YigB (HAD superfamily)